MGLFGSVFQGQAQTPQIAPWLASPRRRGLFGGLADYLNADSGTPGVNRLQTIGATLKDIGGAINGGSSDNLQNMQLLAQKQRQDATAQAWQAEQQQRQRQEWQAGDSQKAAVDQWISSLPPDQQQMARINPEAAQKAYLEQQKPKEPKYFNTGQAIVGITPDGKPQILYQDPKKEKGGGLTVDENGQVILSDSAANDPLTINRYALASNRITKVLQGNNAFKAVISGGPYLDRIEAAMQHPGSVGDQEMLDAFTQLNNGGGRVTEAQVNLITHNQSLADWVNKMQAKLRQGGALSQAQREEMHKLSQTVYKNYQASYKPMYEQAAKQLTAAKIPKQFWTIPDPEFLSRSASDGGGDTAVPAPEPKGALRARGGSHSGTKVRIWNPATGRLE